MSTGRNKQTQTITMYSFKIAQSISVTSCIRLITFFPNTQYIHPYVYLGPTGGRLALTIRRRPPGPTLLLPPPEPILKPP
jgi:hypothetical protein